MGREQSDRIERGGWAERRLPLVPAGSPPTPGARGTARPSAVETPHGYQLYL